MILDLERVAVVLQRGLSKHLPDGVSMLLLLVDAAPKGRVAYANNVPREVLVRQLRELADRIESSPAEEAT